MIKNILVLITFTPIFFNVTLAVHIPNAPKPGRLNRQQRQTIINIQKKEVPNESPKRIRPVDKISYLAAKIKSRTRSVSPERK